MRPFHENLSPLLVGFTVTKVEQGLGREGDPAKITCVKGDVTRTFEVWGGICGPVASNLQESRGVGPFLLRDVDQMFEHITDYVAYHNDPVTITALEDPLNLRLGFRCVETGEMWWVSLSTVKGSKFSRQFETEESRNALAVCLTNCGVGLHADPG